MHLNRRTNTHDKDVAHNKDSGFNTSSNKSLPATLLKSAFSTRGPVNLSTATPDQELNLSRMRRALTGSQLDPALKVPPVIPTHSQWLEHQEELLKRKQYGRVISC